MRRHRLRGLARAESGASTVEFALVALALLLFVFGVVEMGRMLWTWQVLESTAADTARCVAIGSSQCSNGANYAVSVAAGRGVGSLTASEVTVTSTAATTCAGVANFTTVSIIHTYKTMMPAYIPAPSAGLKASACFPNNS